MKIPEYITKEDVRRICKGLKIRDWTKLKVAKVLPKEAKVYLKEIEKQVGVKISYVSTSGDRNDIIKL